MLNFHFLLGTHSSGGAKALNNIQALSFHPKKNQAEQSNIIEKSRRKSFESNLRCSFRLGTQGINSL